MRRMVPGVATALGLAVVAPCVMTWLSATRLTQVTPVTESYPLRVLGIDTAAATVTLSRGLDADEPGEFRLSWPTGHATVGPVIAEDQATVTRSLGEISGRLATRQRVGIQSDPLTGDPRSALGLAFRDVTVSGPAGALPAWYIGGTRPTWVILIHGLDGSRSDTLPAMASLHAGGWPMLAITYRNDTGAARSADHRSHLGDTEWRDVEAAIGFATSHGAQGVVLYGWSLGGAMAVVTSEQSLERHQVRALVLDSPLLDWPATMNAATGQHGIPTVGAWATRAMLAVALGVHLNRYREPALAAALTTPTLLIQGSADRVVPPTTAAAFARARPDLITYLRVSGADHVSAIDTDPGEYTRALASFLSAYGAEERRTQEVPK